MIFSKYFTSFLALLLLLLLVTCKKEFTTKESNNAFGTIIGNGNQHSIGEVIQTDDDQYLICGTVARGDNGMCDGYAMKLDQQYNVIWYHHFGGSNQDFIKSMAMDDKGNCLLVGSSYSFGESLDTSNYARNSFIYLVYIDQFGQKIWEKTHKPNDKPGVKNVGSQALKVAYTKNNKFCVAGATSNYSTDRTSDGYSFGMDDQGNIEWSSNYFAIPVKNNGYQDHESIDDVSLSDDGNLMLLFKFSDTLTGKMNGVLLKVAANSTGYQENKKLWRGEVMYELAENPYGSPSSVCMKVLSNRRIAVTRSIEASYLQDDTTKNQLFITDDLGKVLIKKKFKHSIFYMTINQRDGKIVLSGFYKIAQNIFPCWIITDLNGNILKENYMDLGFTLKDKMHVRSSFINRRNEVVSFIELSDLSGSYINIIRFDQNGIIIK